MSKSAKPAKQPRPQVRFGIAEWYGRSFIHLSQAERSQYAEMQFRSDAVIPTCPFLSTSSKEVKCSKKGGVCSLRTYELSTTGEAQLDGRGSTVRTLCPARFEEGSEIYRWIGEVVLGSNVAVPIGQINFLERVPLIGAADEGTTRLPEVGRIDNVLVIPGSDPLQWCPVEIQAVYFSGPNMQLEFKTILEYKGSGVPFPSRVRRPDYRSSAPKRLMPQLQIKVPDLSRWGKKMAVVVDQDFFNAMGKMETVTDLSNCDVVWFVVRYKEGEGRVRLVRGAHVYTKLQSAVDGLIAGRATAQEKFEEKIRDKLKYRSP